MAKEKISESGNPAHKQSLGEKMFRGKSSEKFSADKDLLIDNVYKILVETSKHSEDIADALNRLKRKDLNKIIDVKSEDTLSTKWVEGGKMSLLPSNFEPVDINISLTKALNDVALNIAESILSGISSALIELALSKPYEETDEEKKIYESERIQEAVIKRIEADKRDR